MIPKGMSIRTSSNGERSYMYRGHEIVKCAMKGSRKWYILSSYDEANSPQFDSLQGAKEYMDWNAAVQEDEVRSLTRWMLAKQKEDAS